MTGTHVAVNHGAECPEINPVACAAEEIPEHSHSQTISWMRVQPSIRVGLGKAWQAHLELPVDTKALGIAYALADGTPYEPPYAGTHHRNETLFGLADPALGIKRAGMWGEVMLNSGFQLRLPLGETEEDPFSLAAEGIAHQHFQMGTGTVMPEASMDAVRMGMRWGWLAYGQGRLPLYENAKGYQPGRSATIGGGAIWRATPTLMTTLMIEGTHEGKDFWAGAPSPSSGRDMGVVSVGLGGPLPEGWGEGWTFDAALRTTVYQKTFAEDPGDQLTQRFVGVLGVSRTFGQAHAAH
jgi:hypothetical protein